jgi:2-amino-4-hydroxy-6-hydroxymethyldihydropteridine diphosphokinase
LVRAYIGIGSNIAAERNIRSALTELRRRYGPIALSPVYRGAPIGFAGDDFYNLVAALDTGEPAQTLIEALHAIEQNHGRVRAPERFAPRTLDLDLLLYGDLVRHDTVLDLPRPEILQYAFVLRPLAELAPGERHPETGETYRELWGRLQPLQELQPVNLKL